MTIEFTFAAVLATAFVLMTVAFRRPGEASTRLARKGHKIEWDRPESINGGDW